MARNLVGTNLFENKTSTLDICLTDDSGLAVFAKCTGVPPVTVDLFQHGCLMNQTDSGAGTAAVYENIGTPAAPNWVKLGNGALVFTPDQFAAANITLVDDAAAATKSPVFLYCTRRPETYALGVEPLPSGASSPGFLDGAVSDSGGLRAAFLVNSAITEANINLVDAAPGVGDSQVFFRPNAVRQKGVLLGRLVSNNAIGANSMFTIVDVAGGIALEQVPVYMDPNAGTGVGDYLVGIDANLLTPSGERLIVESQWAQDCYIQTQKGRYILLKGGALGPNPPAFFDDNGADSRLRLLANTAIGDRVNAIRNDLGDLQIDGVVKVPLFVKPGIAAGSFTFRANVTTSVPGTIFYVRIGDRVIPVRVDAGAGTGTPVFYDASAAIASRLVVDFAGAGNGTVAIARDAKPDGYNTTGTIS